jgi:hypothetical protein
MGRQLWARFLQPAGAGMIVAGITLAKTTWEDFNISQFIPKSVL